MLIRSYLQPQDMSEWKVVNQGTLNVHGAEVPLGRVTLTATSLSVEEGHVIDQRKVFGSQ